MKRQIIGYSIIAALILGAIFSLPIHGLGVVEGLKFGGMCLIGLVALTGTVCGVIHLIVNGKKKQKTCL